MQWDDVVKNLQELSAYAAQRKVRLSIEPLNRYETDFINTCSQVLKLVDDIGNEALLVLQLHRVERAAVGINANEEGVLGGDFVHS